MSNKNKGDSWSSQPRTTSVVIYDQDGVPHCFIADNGITTEYNIANEILFIRQREDG